MVMILSISNLAFAAGLGVVIIGDNSSSGNDSDTDEPMTLHGSAKGIFGEELVVEVVADQGEKSGPPLQAVV